MEQGLRMGSGEMCRPGLRLAGEQRSVAPVRALGDYMLVEVGGISSTFMARERCIHGWQAGAEQLCQWTERCQVHCCQERLRKPEKGQ